MRGGSSLEKIPKYDKVNQLKNHLNLKENIKQEEPNHINSISNLEEIMIKEPVVSKVAEEKSKNAIHNACQSQSWLTKEYANI